MSVNLVLLKSGEEIIADVKEIKSGKEVIGYYFDQPFIVNYDPDEEPQILQESETTLKYNASVSIGFFPWIPFADDRKNITLSRKKISNKFPIIGTEKDVTEIIVRSNILILLKSKKPGKRVK